MSCHCQDEVIRDGSSQLSRYLKALDPDYAPIDDRSIEELLVYAKRYASQIRYYEPPDSNTSLPDKLSWREFFRRDLAVIGASMAVTDLSQIKKDYDETRASLDLDPKQSVFGALFNPIIGMLVKVDRWFEVAIPANPLYEDLKLGIDSTLKEQVRKIRAYEEGFRLVVDPAHPIDLNLSDKLKGAMWDLDGPVVPDVSIYAGTDTRERIRHAALFADDIFLTSYGFLQNMVNMSPGYITYALELYPEHQPHIGLFIAFLKLFRLAQDQMNELPSRMLDFYYREVLQLEEKPAIPDRVHIVFELAKDVTEYDVEEHTSLDGGKDNAGVDLVYKTESDLVVNQAKVKELKTIHIQKNKLADQNKFTLEYIDAKPVANSLDGYGEKFVDPHPMWPTFGKSQPNLLEIPANLCKRLDLLKDLLEEKVDTKIGFAVASPQLLMQSGNRLLSVNVPDLPKLFTAETAKKISLMFTAEKEWMTIGESMSDDQYAYLSSVMSQGDFGEEPNRLPTVACSYFDLVEGFIWVYFPVEAEGIIAFDPKLHTGSFITPHPVMQILIGPGLELDQAAFVSSSFANISIQVRVGSMSSAQTFDGLKKLILKNEQGDIKVDEAFDPLTQYALPGNSLYVGGSEIFNKTIDELSLSLEFFSDTVDDSLSISHLDKRAWSFINDGLNFSNLRENFLVTATGVPVTLDRHPLIGNEPLDKSSSSRGFIRIQYLPDFGEFPPTGSEAMEAAMNVAIGIQTKDISASYHSRMYRLERGYDQFFHVYPFGCAEVNIVDERNLLKYTGVAEAVRNSIPKVDRGKDGLWVNTEKLFPQFTYLSPYSEYSERSQSVISNAGGKVYEIRDAQSAYGSITKTAELGRLLYGASGLTDRLGQYSNQYSGQEEEEGLLFIGLENLKPLQTLSLLFQFAEGTAEDEDNDPPEIHWSYLANNEWRPMKGENILSDGTYGFQATGIIKFEIPKEITNNNTIITNGLHWLCASVTKDSNRIPRMIDVVAQAVVAQLEDHENDPSHFDEALPAGTIGKLTTGVAAVSKVIQPFESWGAKHKEVGKEFYARVSERLRHKNRTVNAWDYEHIILDRFPSLYKIKAIPHTDPNCLCRHPEPKFEGDGYEDCCGPQIAPGHVLLVPISNLKNRVSLNPLQPKTGRRTLREIEQFVSTLKDPFVQVHARNPVYEQIIVFFRVKFRVGVDKGYYLKKLNDEIVHFLTPWAFDPLAEVRFGDKVYSSSIVNFIEERPYVDFITDFMMGVCHDQCCPPTAKLAEPAGTDTQEQTVTGVVKDSITEKPLKDVRVRFGNETTTTSADGLFTIGSGTVAGSLIVFELEGYVRKEFRTGPAKFHNVMLDFDTGKYNVCRKKDDTPAEIFKSICNCEDIEELLQDVANFRGDVVAKPSTPRSILVSAPRHIIVPYEEKAKLTPCELNALRSGQKISEWVEHLEPAEGPAHIDVVEEKITQPKKVAKPKAARKTETKKRKPKKPDT